MVAPQKIFFTERQLKERSGCGCTREIQTSKRLKRLLFLIGQRKTCEIRGNYFLLVIQVFLIVFMWCFSNTIYLPSFVDTASTQSLSLLQALSLEKSSWFSANSQMHFTQDVPSMAQY